MKRELGKVLSICVATNEAQSALETVKSKFQPELGSIIEEKLCLIPKQYEVLLRSHFGIGKEKAGEPCTEEELLELEDALRALRRPIAVS